MRSCGFTCSVTQKLQRVNNPSSAAASAALPHPPLPPPAAAAASRRRPWPLLSSPPIVVAPPCPLPPLGIIKHNQRQRCAGMPRYPFRSPLAGLQGGRRRRQEPNDFGEIPPFSIDFQGPPLQCKKVYKVLRRNVDHKQTAKRQPCGTLANYASGSQGLNRI